jgi:hypothetical protein
MSHGHKLFSKPKLVYGTEVKFPDKKNNIVNYHAYNHEAPFRPANLSRGTIDKFPEFMPQEPIPKPITKKVS